MAHEPEHPDTEEPLSILLWVVTGLAVVLLALGGLASYFLQPKLEPFIHPTRPPSISQVENPAEEADEIPAGERADEDVDVMQPASPADAQAAGE